MSRLASGCVCWFREKEKDQKIDYSSIVGLEEYMLKHPTLVASVLPNGDLWCYPMTSFAKQGIEYTTQNISTAQKAFFAPVAPTKPHPYMPFRVELDRKLKTCGRSNCIDTNGCEDGCSFTCSYVNLEKPFRIPPSTLSPFLRLRNGGFEAVRLSHKSREDVAGVLQQYMSTQKPTGIGLNNLKPSELSQRKKAKFEAHVKAGGLAHHIRNLNHQSPSTMYLSDQAPTIGSEPFGKVAISVITCGLPGPSKRETAKLSRETVRTNRVTCPQITAGPKLSKSCTPPAKTALTSSKKMRKECLDLELREQATMNALRYRGGFVQQRAREQANHDRWLKEHTNKRKEKLVSHNDDARKIEEFFAKVKGLSEPKLTYLVPFLSDNLPGIADSLAHISELVDSLEVVESRRDKVGSEESVIRYGSSR